MNDFPPQDNNQDPAQVRHDAAIEALISTGLGKEQLIQGVVQTEITVTIQVPFQQATDVPIAANVMRSELADALSEVIFRIPKMVAVFQPTAKAGQYLCSLVETPESQRIPVKEKRGDKVQ